MSDVWERLARRLREIAREEAAEASPPVERFRVRTTEPLVLEDLDGQVVLSDADDDLDVDDRLRTSPPDVGDLVICDRHPDGDRIARGVVKEG